MNVYINTVIWLHVLLKLTITILKEFSSIVKIWNTRPRKQPGFPWQRRCTAGKFYDLLFLGIYFMQEIIYAHIFIPGETSIKLAAYT